MTPAAIRLLQRHQRFGHAPRSTTSTWRCRRGSLYGFIGPNGSGKSTTLRMIMHILLPDEGEIEVWARRTPARRTTG